MSPRDRAEFVADGVSPVRRAAFAMSRDAVYAWERTHPMSLDQYLNFLEDMQHLFGPLSVPRARSALGPFLL